MLEICVGCTISQARTPICACVPVSLYCSCPVPSCLGFCFVDCQGGEQESFVFERVDAKAALWIISSRCLVDDASAVGEKERLLQTATARSWLFLVVARSLRSY